MKFTIRSQRALRWVFISLGVFIMGAIMINALHTRNVKETIYQEAIQQINSGDYNAAIEQLQTLDLYQDAKEYIQYAEALILEENEQYREAAKIFETLGDFVDSKDKLTEIEKELALEDQFEESYNQAVTAYEQGEYYNAWLLLEQIGDYKDSLSLKETIKIYINRFMQSDTISAGIRYSAGVTEEGNVLFSGEKFADAEKISTWTNMVSVSASNEFLAGLREDGSVEIAKRQPHYNYRIDTSEWKDIVDISVGEQYIVGLRSDGTLTAQGIDGYGETNIDDWKDIVQIDTGWQHTVGLDRYGNIHVVGMNADKLTAEIEDNQKEWTNVISIATGGSSNSQALGRGHIVGLRKDGTVVAVGDNTYGQCNVSTWTDIIAISAGDFHTVGLKSDGTVLTTQTEEAYPDSYEDINSWSDIVSVSAGYGFTLAERSDGTVVATGFNQDGQCNVSEWAQIANRNEWSLIFQN